MRNLEQSGFLRLHQIIGDHTTEPPTPALIPVSRTTWLDGVKSGRYPTPVKIGARAVAWRSEDIRKLIDAFGAEG